ncbi:hypothetical protein AGMMS50248_00520 [Deltaproteobacteria bacterium]|nr:hypothetical protein AGMMS50248_00520 [Deltaproteobacteria bacterium]
MIFDVFVKQEQWITGIKSLKKQISPDLTALDFTQKICIYFIKYYFDAIVRRATWLTKKLNAKKNWIAVVSAATTV